MQAAAFDKVSSIQSFAASGADGRYADGTDIALPGLKARLARRRASPDRPPGGRSCIGSPPNYRWTRLHHKSPSKNRRSPTRGRAMPGAQSRRRTPNRSSDFHKTAHPCGGCRHGVCPLATGRPGRGAGASYPLSPTFSAKACLKSACFSALASVWYFAFQSS